MSAPSDEVEIGTVGESCRTRVHLDSIAQDMVAGLGCASWKDKRRASDKRGRFWYWVIGISNWEIVRKVFRCYDSVQVYLGAERW